MSQVSYRGNLSAAVFPMSLAHAGRSVIVPGPDNNYDRRVDPEGEQKAAGIPQAIYLENVFPTADGYQSVGYVAEANMGISGAIAIYPLYAVRTVGLPETNVINVAYLAGGTTFKASNISGLGNWTNIVFSGTAEYPTNNVSSAVVRGVCYVLIHGPTVQLYTAEHTGAALTLTNITASVTGVTTFNDIRYVIGVYNYLVIVLKDGTVQWSSTITPTDFSVSLVTGAGTAKPNNLFGDVSGVEPNSSGFYLMAASGIISAQYTGNSRYPWRFVPVSDTTSVISFSSGDVNSSNIVVLDNATTIRRVEGNQSVPIAPEVSAYIKTEQSFDRYDHSTDVISLVTLAASGGKTPKIYLKLDRFVCVSCDYTVADGYCNVLIYDIQTRRYGKLGIKHHYLVEFTEGPHWAGTKSIGFINILTGACNYLSFRVEDVTSPHDAVLVMGKFQYARSRNLCLDEIQLEGKLTNASVRVLPSLNGKVFDTAITPSLKESAQDFAWYTCRTEARNHSVVIKGQFSVSSLELTFHLGGGR